jgi:predicted dehydrogenase
MFMSKSITRRKFLATSAAGLAGGAILSAVPASSYARILGANDTINMAVIGIRGRGGSHIENFGGMKNVRLKYLVDVDANLFESRIKDVEKQAGYRPKTEMDMRKVYDDKEIDAVGIATTNHWHALSTIWAVQAGKHVYVEKPSSHNMFEGQKMIEAARKYNVLVQVGFQNRSRANAIAGIKFLHEGKLGDIYWARGLCFKPRASIGKYPDGPMKDDEKFRMTLETDNYETPYTEAYLSKVDYDMWLGPAPKKPFNRNHFHYNWHWHWDYGNGDTGNQGPHQFDIARWGLNRMEYPVKVSSKGGYFVYDSSQETPNTQTSMFEYADGKILEFSTRGVLTNPEGIDIPAKAEPEGIDISAKAEPEGIDIPAKAKSVKIGNIFLGSEGWMQMDSGGNWQTFIGRKSEPGPTSGDTDTSYDPMNLSGAGDEGHFANFIKALRSGKQSDLTCDVAVGQMSSDLPLMANIAYRLGRELTFDGQKYEFVGDDEANAMKSRNYRDPYVVPEKI